MKIMRADIVRDLAGPMSLLSLDSVLQCSKYYCIRQCDACLFSHCLSAILDGHACILDYHISSFVKFSSALEELLEAALELSVFEE